MGTATATATAAIGGWFGFGSTSVPQVTPDPSKSTGWKSDAIESGHCCLNPQLMIHVISTHDTRHLNS